MLVAEGAKVVVLDNFSRGNHRIDGVEYVGGDAGDVKVCEDVFCGAHTVLNLVASIGGLYFNIANQLGQLWDNFRLQTAPVIAAKKCKVANFLQVSTSCVYADEHSNPCAVSNETLGEPSKANEGYARAKRLGEAAARLAFEGTETKYVIVRPTNMYGERDYFDENTHVIPALIKRFVDGDSPVIVYGGKQQREFLHAEDGARGMLEAMKDGKNGGVYNLGTDGATRISIEALARMIDLLSEAEATIEFVSDVEIGGHDRYTDCTQARMDFVWYHRIELLEGLARTIEYYRCQVT